MYNNKSENIYVVAEKDGKFWGKGIWDEFGFFGIEHAVLSDPKHCKKPEDKTYKTNPAINELKKAKLVKVKVIETRIIERVNH